MPYISVYDGRRSWELYQCDQCDDSYQMIFILLYYSTSDIIGRIIIPSWFCHDHLITDGMEGFP